MIIPENKQYNLVIGDLVYHLLYGRQWVAVILAFGAPPGITKNPEVTLVRMQPGTEFENHFSKSGFTKYKLTSSMGYVSHHWLRPLILLEGSK